ncbi:F-box/WD repeat-containing protein 8 isoform X2 [Sinocyclocheilus grahami]|uniref:F-box/WD repeat-containing protein 8 isoform X2 n=1 Tax=Sinocyclocheilus grahami TaxID=75366 RepID=UPI0007AD5A4B|nr:PREDICTED: F-box/WD repeat-containing protein 8 isoform X2 [Sinocyclocheilus grahami]
MGVTTVQADDWKIVSGGGEGLVSVWEMRIGAKLWEMHNRVKTILAMHNHTVIQQPMSLMRRTLAGLVSQTMTSKLTADSEG